MVALQNVFMLLRWGCNCVYDAIKSFGRSLRWPPRVLRSAVKLERAPPLETCVQGCREVEQERRKERVARTSALVLLLKFRIVGGRAFLGSP